MKQFLFPSVILFLSFTAIAQRPFKEVGYKNLPDTLSIPEGMSYTVLFSQGDTVIAKDGRWAPAKGAHDMILALPSSEKGIVRLAVSHECNDSSSVLGDGGGMSLITLTEKNGVLKKTQPAENIDFSPVGGTFNNCSGTLVTGKGTILTAEEGTPESNTELFKNGSGYRNVSDINGIARHKNTGWMVEVDPVSKTALQKVYGMGRFVHECALTMPDGKTVYLTDDYAPSVFFKFVADTKNDFSKGQLYAYRQETDHWIKLPMQMDSLIQIRDVALRMGATYFLRLEWMTVVNGKIYLTETGYDGFLAEPSKVHNGKPAKHLHAFTLKPGLIDHPFGSVLVFDPVTDEVTPLLHGGAGTKFTDKHFANPDAITFVVKDGKTYLVIQEDITNSNRGRASEAALMARTTVNEVYWLDLSIAKPGVDDLQRFLVAPAGAETSGGTFIQGNTSWFFINIQHPAKTNPAPFNKSCTILINLNGK